MEGGNGKRERDRERGREMKVEKRGRERERGRKERGRQGKKDLTTKMIAPPIKQILGRIAPVFIPLGDGGYAVPMVPPIAPVASPEDVEAAC